MKPGDSILIHAGTGGIGQAAINVALGIGCTVFTTVGTPEKRKFIREKFPQIEGLWENINSILPIRQEMDTSIRHMMTAPLEKTNNQFSVTDSHIGNSRDTSFEDMVKMQTKGRGVDFVLNSLAEEKLIASVRCLARGGRFLEIGKFDLVNNNRVNLEFFEKEASYHGVMVDMLFYATPSEKKVLTDLISQGLKKGYVKPIETTVFKENQIEEAYRYMAAGKHMGKVLIKIRDEEPQKIVVPEFKITKAIPR